ncbi:hypothetical protein [Streptosporangium minutum]|uniref:Uncharacterized protein n=1 Tax=Streptosporangium minutum TaxID=569862 RepID=A0A243RG59_9ACTN|nr:hypothetical protein [Streptosporangium minutum]OUC93713.1 hypothetical protein CA984_25400 [Streptosporangium minutum]
MPHTDLVAHYRHLLDVAQWLDYTLSWTVIQPLAEPMDVTDIAESVAGSGYEIQETDVEGEGLFIDESGPSIMLLDLEGGFRSPHELERLSIGARVWDLFWGVNGHSSLVYAADGHIRLTMPDLDPQEAYGPDPQALNHLLRLLPEPFTRLSNASAMALVQMDSGAHLDLEWLDDQQRKVIVSADT